MRPYVTQEADRCNGTRSRGERGLTLVEVVVASAVLAIAAMGLAAALTAALRAGSAARERTVALTAAESRMESLLVVAANGSAPIVMSTEQRFPVEGLTPPPGATGAGRSIVSPWLDDVVYVDVKVEWRGSLGDDSLQLVTLTIRR